MRQLLRYLHREGILSDDYSSAILTVRCRKIVPSVYGKTEIEAMLSSVNRASSVGIQSNGMIERLNIEKIANAVKEQLNPLYKALGVEKIK